MRLLPVISLCIILQSGCSGSKVNIDRLEMRQGKYYLVSSPKPFNGKVVSKYDNGNISNIIEMKEGVPNGKWVAYGYQKELVQEGSYNPINLSNEADFLQDSIKRLNVCITKEGEVEFTDIFLITDAPAKKEATDEKLKILTFLKKHSILIKGDTINEIKYVRGELSN